MIGFQVSLCRLSVVGEAESFTCLQEPDEPPYDPCEGEPDEPYDSPPFWWPPHEPEGGYGGYPEPYFGDGDDDNEGPEWGPFSSGPEWEPDSDSPWYPWESDNGDD